MMYKCVNSLVPAYISCKIGKRSNANSYNLHNSEELNLPECPSPSLWDLSPPHHVTSQKGCSGCWLSANEGIRWPLSPNWIYNQHDQGETYSMLCLLLLLGLTTLNPFLPRCLASDWLYITRATEVSFNSRKPFWPQNFITVSLVMMFTVDPLSNSNFSCGSTMCVSFLTPCSVVWDF